MLSVEQVYDMIKQLSTHPRNFSGSIQLEIFTIDGNFKRKFITSSPEKALDILDGITELRGVTLTIR